MRTVGSVKCLIYCIALQGNNSWFLKKRILLNLYTLITKAFRMLCSSITIILYFVSLRPNEVTGIPPIQRKKIHIISTGGLFRIVLFNKVNEIHAWFPASLSCFNGHSLGNYQGPACFSQLSLSLWSMNTCQLSKGIYSRNNAFVVPMQFFQAYTLHMKDQLFTNMEKAISQGNQWTQTPIRRLSSCFVCQKAVTVQKM